MCLDRTGRGSDRSCLVVFVLTRAIVRTKRYAVDAHNVPLQVDHVSLGRATRNALPYSKDKLHQISNYPWRRTSFVKGPPTRRVWVPDSRTIGRTHRARDMSGCRMFVGRTGGIMTTNGSFAYATKRIPESSGRHHQA
jgi:hypothetical protein